jgi:hypothetical protein
MLKMAIFWDVLLCSLIIPLMMETEIVSEMLGFFPQLTWLVTRKDFIEFSHRESFKSDRY